jgi:hypothetical protein
MAVRKRIIHDPETGEPYLVRWSLFSWLKVHRILREDVGRDLHDHPWRFVSIVLWGWYDEEIPYAQAYPGRPISCPGPYSDATVVRRVRWFNFKRPEGQHRIVKVSKRCWTLVVNGPHVRTWGFHTAQGFVPWFTYFEEKS